MDLSYTSGTELLGSNLLNSNSNINITNTSGANTPSIPSLQVSTNLPSSLLLQSATSTHSYTSSSNTNNLNASTPSRTRESFADSISLAISSFASSLASTPSQVRILLRLLFFSPIRRLIDYAIVSSSIVI